MLDIIKKIDWFILFLLLLFMGVSTAVIYSATIHNPSPAYHHLYIKNIVLYGAGFFVLFITASINFRFILRATPFLYGIGILLLIAVYLFAGEVNHSKSWFRFGGFSFQPAELVKVFLILMIAYILNNRSGNSLRIVGDVVPIGLVTFVPFALVLIEPDLGNAVIYVVIMFGMIWIGNMKYLQILIGLVVIVGSFLLFVHLYLTFHDNIKHYLEMHGVGRWVGRIDALLNPQSVSSSELYQVDNSKTAIGSGELLGEGYLHGIFVQKNYIPYSYADSIFVVIGEEFGFVGTSLLLLLYFLLIYRLIYTAIISKSRAGSFAIMGIVTMFVIHIFENIGMLIGLMPLTGITLPFISYGGSSLFINMISIGLVMSVRIHHNINHRVNA